MNPPNQMFADGGCSGDGEGDLQELEQHGAQPLQERHHLVQGGKKSPGSRWEKISWFKVKGQKMRTG